MTILNVNDLKEFNEQPTEYNTEEELIDWLKWDLYQQAIRNGKIPNENNIVTITDEEEKEFEILIGNINKKIIINDYIDLENILKYFLNNREINYKITFSNLELKNTIRIHEIIFNNIVQLLDTKIGKVYCVYSHFFDEVIIKTSTFDNDIYFEDCHFYNSFKCISSKFSMFRIINSIFNEKIRFDNNVFNGFTNFSNSIFNNEVFFNESYSSYSNFNDIIIINCCKFNNGIIFENIDINEDMYISNTNIINSIKFFETSICKNMELYNLNIDYIIFNKIKMKNSSTYLSLINSNDIKELSFVDINIDGKINLQNIEVNEADFKGSIINGGLINPVNFKVNKFANRESALFLKQQAYAVNNTIDALQYKSKEIECHKDDLIKSAKDIIQNKEYSFSKKIKELYKIVGDIASIYLSSLYSDNGQNWIKALFMTIFITIICFTVFYIPDLTKANIIRLYYKNLFPELIKYFIPTDYSLIIKYAASKLNLFLKIFGVLVYFLGKVLFWYGSVQTVQAFRKFSKGA
ncbi:hypothetical protein JQ824_07645 [Brachyspira hyodysenteriae]|uniref:hypothetical protein n=1 Tax=Brachyspira hyodysenteriae TaxID=159 RepID=UPI00063D9600|nr:hypothetical protein [Brachyspira hyodysenteriae]KLI17433.1 hypothetical protein SU44_03775 [Brachyspira hyodysenteriae]MBT8720269.1 hypothetical protein [Brachyspira hyodysenteriae]MBT8730507.1 hypothetical protein [Brachyspira hyodysenteriae]MBT8733589.1 hypothetical protein [Brachyspira hyodysenteriae]MBT8735612.1 hypothetical protein [Brachyspira hyodysenteriae]